MMRAVGHPVAVNPDRELERVAREEGWRIMRFDKLGRRLRWAAAVASVALVGGGGGVRRRTGTPPAAPAVAAPLGGAPARAPHRPDVPQCTRATLTRLLPATWSASPLKCTRYALVLRGRRVLAYDEQVSPGMSLSTSVLMLRHWPFGWRCWSATAVPSCSGQSRPEKTDALADGRRPIREPEADRGPHVHVHRPALRALERAR